MLPSADGSPERIAPVLDHAKNWLPTQGWRHSVSCPLQDIYLHYRKRVQLNGPSFANMRKGNTPKSWTRI